MTWFEAMDVFKYHLLALVIGMLLSFAWWVLS